MKRLLLTFGTASAVGSPLITVVSCNEEANQIASTPEEIAKELIEIKELSKNLDISSTLTFGEAGSAAEIITNPQYRPFDTIASLMGIEEDVFNSILLPGWKLHGFKAHNIASWEGELLFKVSFIAVVHESDPLAYYEILQDISWQEDTLVGTGSGVEITPESEYSEKLIPYDEYVNLHNTIEDDEIALAIIQDDEYWIDIVPYSGESTLEDAIYHLDESIVDIPDYSGDHSFTFQTSQHASFGTSLEQYMVEGVHTTWQSGSEIPGITTWGSTNLGLAATNVLPATLYQFSFHYYE